MVHFLMELFPIGQVDGSLFASRYGHTIIVQLLLEQDADVNSSTNIVCVCVP